MTPAALDFTAFAHPVLAVTCPTCRKKPGAMCHRPSGHRASDFHSSRRAEADRVFVAQHGPEAGIDRTPTGWKLINTGDAA